MPMTQPDEPTTTSPTPWPEEPAPIAEFRKQLGRPLERGISAYFHVPLADIPTVIAHLDRLASGTGEREHELEACLRDAMSDFFDEGTGWTRRADVLLGTASSTLLEQAGFRANEWERRATSAETERDSLRSDLATAKRELEALEPVYVVAELAHLALGATSPQRQRDLGLREVKRRLTGALCEVEAAIPALRERMRARVAEEFGPVNAELESSRSQPVVSTGERPSDEELMDIVRDRARYDIGARSPCLPPYPCTPSERRALYDAGVARGEARITEALRLLRQGIDVSTKRDEENPGTRLYDAAGHQVLIHNVERAVAELQPAEPKAEQPTSPTPPDDQKPA